MIKNLIFDLGGVFVNLDQSATLRELSKFGFFEVSPEINALFQQYECGQLTTDVFLEKASSITQTSDRDRIVEAWNAIIIGFPVHRLEFLLDLAQTENYKLFLMSNTNELHLQKVALSLGKKEFEDFESSFIKCYYSHLEGMRKPDHSFFRLILDDHNLEADETLFIDDTFTHVNAARELGIQTWHLIPGKADITDLYTHIPDARPRA